MEANSAHRPMPRGQNNNKPMMDSFTVDCLPSSGDIVSTTPTPPRLAFPPASCSTCRPSLLSNLEIASVRPSVGPSVYGHGLSVCPSSFRCACAEQQQSHRHRCTTRPPTPRSEETYSPSDRQVSDSLVPCGRPGQLARRRELP